MKNTMYDPKIVEPKWQDSWAKQELFQHSENQQGLSSENKKYILFAFAYPSGSGLHVGHVESKTALDIVVRYHRMHGQKVFFPVGWDAFGLPAENYAIKTGVHPKETTHQAIDTFRRQIQRLGISYDWANELATSHPGYYQWTQWIFLQLYKKGMAYRKTGAVNWCPSCQTVLANEQVVDGSCERCGTAVVQKELEQWFFKITDYKDELITGLDQVDWPAATKQQQINWIGKSSGITVTFKVADSDQQIDCFTTWPTNWGASFVVLAPEHPVISKITTLGQKKAVDEYLEKTKSHSESERARSSEKTGVFTGAYVINHVTNQKIPVWISDFALMHVGTGAVQGCPGHDMRDFEFAKKFDLPIPRVVVGQDGDTSEITRPEQVLEKGASGKMINSDFINGMDFAEGIYKTMDYFVEKGWAKRVTTYKLRDWLISRQRYWGAPIPIVYDPQGNPHPVKEEHLPWTLPTDVEFKPTGESPLKLSKEFIERTERLYGKGWRPEFDTMDTFVDSSWYFLRYVGARFEAGFTDLEQANTWLPVDLYMIGPEHIVLHLLYSRFFTKFLADEGYLKFREPFMKMRHQGMILGPDGRKMSKSKGNVINPDDVIEKFGADSLRVYEMFMGPLEADKAWDPRALIGIHKFLQRTYRLIVEHLETAKNVGADNDEQKNSSVRRKLNQTIRKVTTQIPLLKFNTAIAAMMEFTNTWEGSDSSAGLTREEIDAYIRVLAPFAPFLAEELYQMVHPGETVHMATWPTWDEGAAQEEQITIAVQVNGKLRDECVVAYDLQLDEEQVVAKASSLERVKPYLQDKEILRTIYVPGRIVNFVVR